MSDLKLSLRQFVVDHFLFGRDDGFADQDSFLERGILDSTGVLELVSHLEETYRIRVEDAELTPENLDSIDSIAAFLGRKSSETPPGNPADS